MRARSARVDIAFSTVQSVWLPVDAATSAWNSTSSEICSDESVLARIRASEARSSSICSLLIRSAASAVAAGSSSLRTSKTSRRVGALHQVGDEAQPVQQEAGFEAGDVGAVAAPDVQHAGVRQHPHRLAQRTPGDPQLGGELRLGGQPLAGRQRAGCHQLPDPLHRRLRDVHPDLRPLRALRRFLVASTIPQRLGSVKHPMFRPGTLSEVVVPLSPEDVRALVAAFDGADWDEMTLTVDGTRLVLSRNGRPPTPADAPAAGRAARRTARLAGPTAAPHAGAAVAAAAPPAASPTSPRPPPAAGPPSGPGAAAASAAAAPPAAGAAPAAAPGAPPASVAAAGGPPGHRAVRRAVLAVAEAGRAAVRRGGRRGRARTTPSASSR